MGAALWIFCLQYLSRRPCRFTGGPARTVCPITPDEVETWLQAPAAIALQLQRPLPDQALRIVARGQKQDGAPAPV
jgi:hypothetical protein